MAERGWVQGLIQLAAGLHHLARGRRDPAVRLLVRGRSRLADAPALLDGVDVAGAAAGAGRVLESLARGEFPDAGLVTA